jgi:hypothetical protein
MKKGRQKSVESNLETVDREEYSWSLERWCLDASCTFRYCVLGGFSEPSVCPFGGVLRGSCAWACGTSLSVTLGSRFMILLPGGGSLFEITSSPFGPS